MSAIALPSLSSEEFISVFPRGLILPDVGCRYGANAGLKFSGA